MSVTISFELVLGRRVWHFSSLSQAELNYSEWNWVMERTNIWPRSSLCPSLTALVPPLIHISRNFSTLTIVDVGKGCRIGLYRPFTFHFESISELLNFPLHLRDLVVLLDLWDLTSRKKHSLSRFESPKDVKKIIICWFLTVLSPRISIHNRY